MAADPEPLDRFRLRAEFCKVLTDPKRLLLLAALRDGDRTVGELAASIGSSLPNASQHLAVLRTAGLVDGRRAGATVRYHLAEPAILDACDIVGAIVDRRSARPRAAQRVTSSIGPASNVVGTAPTKPAAPAG